MTAIKVSDLNNAKLDVDHIAAVTTSQASTATDRLGQTKLTLNGALARLGYTPAVIYTVGLSMTNGLQTVLYNDVAYAPLLSQLPFTTSGTFETAKFRVIQGLTFDDLAADDGGTLVMLKRSGIAAAVAESLQGFVDRSSLMVTSLMSDAQRADIAGRTAAESGIAAKINAAAASLALCGGGNLIAPAGKYLLDEPVVLGTKVKIVGEGNTSDSSGEGASCFIRGFTGSEPTFLLSGDDSGLCMLDIQNDSQGTGECWQIIGSRCRVVDVSWYRSGGDGARIGADETTPIINANLWVVERPIGRYSAGAGLLVHNPRDPDATTTQSATTAAGLTSVTLSAPNPNIRRGQTVTGSGIAADTLVHSISGTVLVLDTAATGSGTNTLTFLIWPQGAPDCNAGRLSDHDFSHNGHGLVFGNTIDNLVIGGALQSNTDKGLWLKRNARGHAIYKPYTEANGVELQVDRGATKNHIAVNRFVESSPAWVINDDNNHIEQFGYLDQDAGVSYFWKTLAVMNKAAGGEAKLSFLADTGEALYGQIGGKKDSGAGGRLALRTRSNAGVLTDRIDIREDGAVSIQNSLGLFIGKAGFDTTTPGINIGDADSGANTSINMVGAGSASDRKFGFYNSLGLVGTVITNGSATTYATSSDWRLKWKVAPTDRSAALAAVMSWPICDYTWKASGKRARGAIAHELQQFKPEAVTGVKDEMETRTVTAPDGSVSLVTVPVYQGIDWSVCVPDLIAAVQHLAAKAAALEAKVAAFERGAS